MPPPQNTLLAVITVESSVLAYFFSTMENNFFIIKDTKLTHDLIECFHTVDSLLISKVAYL